MCAIIDRIESHGIDLVDLEHVLRKRPGRPPGPLSEYSIALAVLGAVEDEWRRRDSQSGGTRSG